MSPSKVLCIVNERAGNGAMADHFRRAEHRLLDCFGELDVAFTEEPNHATTLVREALSQGVDTILVGGGDGTLNECVNGLFDGERFLGEGVRLGLLAGGTGGDFRRSLGLERSEDALKAIEGQLTLPLRIGRARFEREGQRELRHFINVASFGLSGKVVAKVPDYRGLGGRLAYFGATLSSLWGWRNPKVSFGIDGGPQGPISPVVTGAIGLGSYFGGGMKICPHATLGADQMALTVLGDLSRLDLLTLTRAIYSGAHLKRARVESHLIERITLEPGPEESIVLELDGEPIASLPAQIELVPERLSFFVPAALAPAELSHG